ncbi:MULTISPECIES: hypothetical protein [unclassified Streptomyces]|uniref:hypothetical protein n=1 Tax=unclassified Streptomyces TaxID=2593676 RepID=UPI000DC7A5E6|nr:MULTISPECIES: hypothetical protein [unclassified Streptomyces]AWZ06879.1 hypothetical protein DRB89_22190 [Streptomyces sp. ICC4]AWZ14542.1 hypothetical protein DRB96_22340 [Streptomyces sp. ICC1]
MQLSLSAVVVLALVLVVMIRGGHLKWPAAIVAVLFGFFLAGTTLAPTVQQGVEGVTSTVSNINP